MTIDDSERLHCVYSCTLESSYDTTVWHKLSPSRLRLKRITVLSTAWRLALYINDRRAFNLLCLLTQLTTGTMAPPNYPVRVSSVSVYLPDDYPDLKHHVPLFPFCFCLFFLRYPYP